MHSKTQLFGLYALITALMASYGAIFALLAEIRDLFGFTATGIGLIGASAFASGFIAQVGLSRFADIGHGARMMQIGLAMVVLSSAWMAFADTLLEWLLSRGLLGFGAGMIRPAFRRMIVVMNPTSAGRSLGVLAAVETVGFVIGPLLAALLSLTLDVQATFTIFAIAFLCFTPFVIGVDVPSAANPPGRDIMFRLLRIPAMQSCIAMGIAFWITIGVFEAIWAIFMADLGADLLFISLTLSLFSIPMIVIAPVAGEYAQKIGPLNVAIVSIGVAITCMVTYGFLTSIWLMCIPLAIHAIADAFTMPASQLAVTQASGEDAIAAGQGLFGATGMAVGAVTAALAGYLYNELGASGLWWVSAAIMLVLMVFAWLRGGELRVAAR